MKIINIVGYRIIMYVLRRQYSITFLKQNENKRAIKVLKL